MHTTGFVTLKPWSHGLLGQTVCCAPNLTLSRKGEKGGACLFPQARSDGLQPDLLEGLNKCHLHLGGHNRLGPDSFIKI